MTQVYIKEYLKKIKPLGLNYNVYSSNGNVFGKRDTFKLYKKNN